MALRIPQVYHERADSVTQMRLRSASQKNSVVHPKHSTHTVWSTALGLHMDSITEDEQDKSQISNMWVIALGTYVLSVNRSKSLSTELMLT